MTNNDERMSLERLEIIRRRLYDGEIRYRNVFRKSKFEDYTLEKYSAFDHQVFRCAIWFIELREKKILLHRILKYHGDEYLDSFKGL